MEQYESTTITLVVNESFFEEFNFNVKSKSREILSESTAFECGFDLIVIESDDNFDYYCIYLESDSKRTYPDDVYIQLSYLIKNIRYLNPDSKVYEFRRDREDWYEHSDIQLYLDIENQNLYTLKYLRSYIDTEIEAYMVQRLSLYYRDFYLRNNNKNIEPNGKEFRKWLISNNPIINLSLPIESKSVYISSLELISRYNHIEFSKFWADKSLVGLV